ncbi:rifin [Plasmodium reichenowi]|uniref:Rifin n=1 Tax=Plasmodium reichenowi TaxID=5854 RepID=A0A060RQT5_PLARE|nr:rifin [Plasmodium reichenowi]
MKVHYINILLFAHALNILVNTHKKNTFSTHRTPKIPVTRLLCECEVYAPANYDNDPEMKKVMQQFEDRTSQRFHEYDDHMVEKRKQCKDKCDKEIQKIILKDKMEKELMDKFATLQTDMQSDAIPTCICEKSIADKVEKNCLRCGYGLGTVAPTVGLIGSVAVGAWKPTILKATIGAALKLYAGKISAAAIKAGDAAGAAKVISELKALGVDKFWPEMSNYIGSSISYTNAEGIAEIILAKRGQICNVTAADTPICDEIDITFNIFSRANPVPDAPPSTFAIPQKVQGIVTQAEGAAKAKVAATKASMEAAVETAQEKAIEAATYNWYATIGYSVLAILIIVLIMVIIYLILRHRRKKKMKKKLQYIKLLEE